MWRKWRVSDKVMPFKKGKFYVGTKKKCQVCGKLTNERKRSKRHNNKLVCWTCYTR